MSRRAAAPLGWAAAGAVALVVAVTAYVMQEPGAPISQLVGSVSQLLAALVAAISCGLAAWRVPVARRAWALLAVAAALWATAAVLWVGYRITHDYVYPFPSLADLFFLGYAVPAAAGLMLFPRAKDRLSKPWRTALDAVVIALAMLFTSWGTVLGPLHQTVFDDRLTRLVSLAYPTVDVVLASLVLALAMRQPAAQVRRWALVGGGFLVLAVTDSIFVFLVSQGQTGLNGGPLVAGWTSAWLLLALAPWASRSTTVTTTRDRGTLIIELLPYVPVLIAVVVSAQQVLQEDLFLLEVGAPLLVAVSIRQGMIVYENVTLTGELEAQVADRTKELTGLGAVVSSSPDAILSMTSEGTVTSWNPGAERLYGWQAQEILGHDASVLVPGWRREEDEAIMARIRRGHQMETESERLHRDGTVVPVAMTLSPIFDGEVVTEIASIQRDITDRRAREVELSSAREEALESSRLKSEFLAMMSHEIRTPMNGVIGLTGLILQTPLDETQQQYALGVQSAGEALMAVINDVLDFSKLEADRVDLELGAFDPRRLVDEVAGLLMQPAHSKRLELIAYCRPAVPSRLGGDEGKIRQILLNLASNAVKFTATGEVVITMHWAATEEGGGVACFEVVDTGIGIAPEARPRVFDAFTQADASTTRLYGGTGLGLAISHRLADAMGGDLDVDSEVGVGSTFTFRVPLDLATEGEDESPAPTHDVLAGLRVLVVDDNATNRMVLESQLDSWGLRADTVADAATVVPILREAVEAGQPYAVVVLDMCMPGIDGVQLARMISADGALTSARLIMLTSAGKVPREEWQKAGVHEWLTKPVRSSDLYDRLMRVMAPPARKATPSVAPDGPAGPAAAKVRVLVVEDNALNQLVAEAVVSKLGYRVDIVANGAEAVEAVDAVDYAAVLMDCHMPVMDGFTATEEIRRRQGSAARTPIIAMTAGAMAEDRERCLAVGMDDYLSKPVKVEAVAEALARWSRPLPQDGDLIGDPRPS